MRGPSGAQGGEALLKQALALLEDAVSAYRKSGSRSNTLIEGSTAVAFPALAAYRSTGERRFLEIAEQLAAEVGATRQRIRPGCGEGRRDGQLSATFRFRSTYASGGARGTESDQPGMEIAMGTSRLMPEGIGEPATFRAPVAPRLRWTARARPYPNSRPPLPSRRASRAARPSHPGKTAANDWKAPSMRPSHGA